MKKAIDSEFDRLLENWNRGDHTAMTAMINLCYEQKLLPLARKILSGDSMRLRVEPSALVNLTWPRLKRTRTSFEHSDRFFRYVEKQMRLALLDLARSFRAPDRGGDASTKHISLEQCHRWMNN